jgi:hypothetical protein
LDNLLAPSTVKTYQKGLELFGYFRKEFDLKDIWPVPLQELFFLFLIYLNVDVHIIQSVVTLQD